MSRFMLLFLPWVSSNFYRAKIQFEYNPRISAGAACMGEKAGPHPRDNVPLCKPAAKLFYARRSGLVSRQTTCRNPLLEPDALYGGLRWASSLLFSPLRLA